MNGKHLPAWEPATDFTPQPIVEDDCWTGKELLMKASFMTDMYVPNDLAVASRLGRKRRRPTDHARHRTR